jgi:hypothetical protein
MPNVLVAIPFRVNTPRVFLDMALQHYTALTYPGLQLAFMPNSIPATEARYGANAQARNELIELYLTPDIDHVLWLDVDLVSVPRNLVETLLNVSAESIVAAVVYVERVQDGPICFDNGGWFYDTGAFIKDGQHASTDPIFAGYTGGAVEVDSIGCCYIVPADVYRKGARYSAIGSEVEHVALMQQARAMGYHVYMTDAARCEHAYLPKYGVAWHS